MILLICGEETYFSLKKISQIKEKFLKDNKEMGIISEYSETNFNLNDFSNKVLPVTFFEEKKLFILNNLLTKKQKKEIISDKEKNILLDILNKAPESSLIVFIERNKKQSNQLTKEIEKKAKKVWEFNKIEGQELTNWAKREIKIRGSQIDKEALDKLLSTSNNDLYLLEQEIEKLSLYKNGKAINIEDVKNIVPLNVQTDIFNFIDSVGRKDNKGALLELNKLFDKGEPPIYILKMLIYQIKNMLIIKDLAESGMKKKEISQTTKKHPYVVEKTLRQLVNFRLDELVSLYNKVFDLEITLKRGGQKPENALIFFAEKICKKNSL